MKVLLDENLPHRLRNQFQGHEVFTVRYQGWSGLKNGELLGTAEREGFDVLLTGDRTLFYEQNLNGRKIAVVLTAIDWHVIRKSLSLIEAAIDVAEPGSCREIECGLFNRKLPRS